VDPITVKALLRPEALARLSAPAHRFCSTASCPVVYFGEGEAFDREEVAVPVFQKEPAGDRTVCYCFAISEADLRREIAAAGRSTAAQRITAHVKAGRCACEIKNPQGSCCLGNGNCWRWRGPLPGRGDGMPDLVGAREEEVMKLEALQDAGELASPRTCSG
jgi:hypothetical protein